MSGTIVTPVSSTASTVETIEKSGIRDVILFGIPERRDITGRQAANANGPVQKAIRSIKSSFGSRVNVISDVCVCQYNKSGHCGISKNGSVDNDSTLELLSRIAMSHTDAGADVVAPSAMMDGQVLAIRSALESSGSKAKILAYSAKHSSSLYTPFRSAAFANKKSIDKSAYQLSPSNPREALREIEMDIAEGADMVMVKPAMAYLDVIAMARDRFDVPIAVQNVSGEYAMLNAAAENEWLDLREWLAGIFSGFKRAGADKIISYFALGFANELFD